MASQVAVAHHVVAPYAFCGVPHVAILVAGAEEEDGEPAEYYRVAVA